MIDGSPSSTALQVAAARAAHLRFDPAPHLLEDLPAADLLGDAAEELIASYADGRPWILLENRIYLPLRARFVEDRLRDAYAAGVRQYVILGAGLDSYAFRQPEGQGALRIYEIDHPSTQHWKLERIRALGWARPENLCMVPCDFEQTSISLALAQSDFDPASRALVSWMGVTYYLEAATVASALRDLSRTLAAGSEVVFDAMLPWNELPARYHELREEMARYLAGAGEPQVNRYTRDALVELIHASGFVEAALASRDELYTRYLEPREKPCPLAERFLLAVARA